MRRQILFVTGTDTGVGKTVLATWLTLFLRQRGHEVMAVKPISSGGRADARALLACQSPGLTLDEINPWHFRAPLAPLTAARLEAARVTKGRVLGYLRRAACRCEVLIVEGAGGLLTPLGEGFNARDLIAELRAVPVVATLNRLGAINQTLLAEAALRAAKIRRLHFALMTPRPTDASVRQNWKVIKELLASPVVQIPFVAPKEDPRRFLRRRSVVTAMETLLAHSIAGTR